jgi:hypothetical protein
VQGTAGTTEDQLRYGWNYALLLAQGPSPQALVPSPVLTAMRGAGRPRRGDHPLPARGAGRAGVDPLRPPHRVPELSGTDGRQVHAAPGFTVIATANLRDRGVSEMSAALKRRFNFETVGPIADLDAETALVRSQATRPSSGPERPFGSTTRCSTRWSPPSGTCGPGRSAEGWEVERPGTVMSTAEAVSGRRLAGAGRRLLPGRP